MLRKMYYFSLILGMSLLVTPVHAERKFVSDQINITVRSGPEMSYKVIAIVSSGEEVEILESKTDWTKIRTQKTKIGWVMTRFLTSDEPRTKLIERLETEKTNSRSLLDENDKLKKENKALKRDFTKQTETLDKITQDYELLKSEAANYLNLKNQHENMNQDYEKLKQNILTLEKDKAVLEANHFYWGFGLALGVLALGFIAGKTMRKKKSSRLI